MNAYKTDNSQGLVPALLALEDGRTFECLSFTGPGEASGEIVFNTGMTGYQEILSGPSYCGQMVTMSYPLIGNYGINLEDMESDGVQAEALLVRKYQADPSNYSATQTLAEFLRQHGKMGIEALDTRALTLHIRNRGAMHAFISTIDLDPETCVEKARALPNMQGRDLTGVASTLRPYHWESECKRHTNPVERLRPDIWQYKGVKPALAVLDFGIKHNILRLPF